MPLECQRWQINSQACFPVSKAWHLSSETALAKRKVLSKKANSAVTLGRRIQRIRRSIELWKYDLPCFSTLPKPLPRQIGQLVREDATHQNNCWNSPSISKENPSSWYLPAALSSPLHYKEVITDGILVPHSTDWNRNLEKRHHPKRGEFLLSSNQVLFLSCACLGHLVSALYVRDS